MRRLSHSLHESKKRYSFIVRREHHPRQLQAKDLHAIINYRTPKVISRNEDFIDSIDALHELPGRDLRATRMVRLRINNKRRDPLLGPRVPQDNLTKIAQPRLPNNLAPHGQSPVDGARQSVPRAACSMQSRAVQIQNGTMTKPAHQTASPAYCNLKKKRGGGGKIRIENKKRRKGERGEKKREG